MNKWIEINLPWTDSTFPKVDEGFYNTLEQRGKQLFGKTLEESRDLINHLYNNETCEFDSTHPEVIAHKKFRETWDKWWNAQPETIEFRQRYDAALEAIKKRSFCGRGLNNPGTLIEIANNSGRIKQYLIGHINPLAGICDDCCEFSQGDKIIVKRYKIIWNNDDQS